MFRIPFLHRLPLRAQGIFFNSLPLLAVLLSAWFAYFSNQKRERMEISMSRHFELVENLVELQTSVAAAEADLRGELLTHGGEFLKSYDRARGMIPEKLERIGAIMHNIPNPGRRAENLAVLDRIRTLLTGEMTVLDSLRKSRKDNVSPGSQIAENQPKANEAWYLLAKLRSSEQRLLSKRLDEIHTVRQRDYLLIFLSVIAGLASRAIAMFFFHRRVVRRVRQLTENARSLRDGSLPVHAPSGHTDDIGELERELARIGDSMAERRIDP